MERTNTEFLLLVVDPFSPAEAHNKAVLTPLCASTTHLSRHLMHTRAS